MKKGILYVFALFLALRGLSQLFPSKIYHQEDGIPSYTIFDITQDSNNIMWFLCPKGVFSYNSREWIVQPDSLKLPNSNFSKIKALNDGTVWVAGQNETNFVVFKYENGIWESIPVPITIDDIPSAFSFDVFSLNSEEKSVLIISKEKIISYSYPSNTYNTLTYDSEKVGVISSSEHWNGVSYFSLMSM